MKLIQARIRGLGTLEESQWFDLSPHLNLFQFPDLYGDVFGRNFLRILQSINPAYDIQTAKPFANFPNFTKHCGYARRVNPAKRTVALAVFSATPSLVKELGGVDEWLYETDRIEVGRRLDYSRWINFVELASSTRWSEITDNMQTLLEHARHLEPDLTNPLADILRPLKPTDRIKNELQEKLAYWLENLPSELQNSSRQLIEKTISAVMRADHFQTARDIVCTRLPLFVVLGSSDSPSSTLEQKTLPGTELDSTSLHNLLHLITSNANSQAKESINGGRTFFDELNAQLEKLPFSGMKLRIDKSPAGVLLTLNGKPVQLSKDEPLSLFRQMQAKACLAVALGRVAYKTEPILLFAGPERALPNTLHGELADFVINIANTCQCLYSFSDVDIFPDDVADRRYNAANLCMAGESQDQSPPMPMDEQR